MKGLVTIALFALSATMVFGKPEFEIRDGNCTTAVGSDVVFQKNVHLSRIPFVTREATEPYYGDPIIYCLLAISGKDKSKNSTVEIIDGGLNHTFVTFEMKSSVSHGFEYTLTVYAK